ncbi:MAG: hypothetical protein HY034_08445 [Nitrospirae bacterium]|nr:hypothetical protein [Nitrospirota bacterium]
MGINLKVFNLDTDGSVKRQELDKYFSINTVELKDIRNNLQFYADKRSIQECVKRINAYDGGSHNLYFLGSGDFHHLTLLTLEKVASPFILIIFDKHTDCSFLYPKYHCGNWMYHAAKLQLCEKVIHIGSTEGHGVLSRLMGISTLAKNGRIAILKSPGDWDNGVMSMAILGDMLSYIIDNFKVAGVDITGEMGGKFYYRYKPVKNIFSFFEHPSVTDESQLFDIDIKQRAINLEILEIFGVKHVAN